MMTTTADPSYPGKKPGSFRPGTILGWSAAIVLSLGLNLFIFGIMPGFIQSVPEGPEDLEAVKAIQVVRVKRPETPPRKKELKKPPEPPKEVKTAARMVQQQMKQPSVVKPRLPMELNPRLPSLPNSINLGPLSDFSMKAEMPQGIFSTSDLDQPLQVMVRLPAAYPMRARRLGIEGWVKVQFVVSKEGRVKELEIVEAEPKGMFESSVTQSVSQYRFKPGTVDGQAVEVRVITTIRFQMEE